MTRVCLLGEPGLNLRYELLSRETAREALSAYELERPYENALAVRTISVGAAVSLLNDLQWYLTRFVDEALVQEPSVDGAEWLSRELSIALRNGDVEPDETGEFCKVYGVETIGSGGPAADGEGTVSARGETVSTGDETVSDAKREGSGREDGAREDTDDVAGAVGDTGTPTRRLVEPLYARRVDGEIPEYDLRDVEDTLVVRVTREEFVG